MSFNTCLAAYPDPAYQCGRGADLNSGGCSVADIFNIQNGAAGLTNVQMGPNQPGPQQQYQNYQQCASACWGEPESSGAQDCTAFSFDPFSKTCTFFTSNLNGPCPMPSGAGSQTVGAVKSIAWQN